MPLSIGRILAGFFFGILVNVILIYTWMDVDHIIVISSDLAPLSRPLLLIGIPVAIAFFDATDLLIMTKGN